MEWPPRNFLKDFLCETLCPLWFYDTFDLAKQQHPRTSA